MSEDILVAYAGDVLEITLNRPERGNGMSDDMIRHLADVVEADLESDIDADIDAVVDNLEACE